MPVGVPELWPLLSPWVAVLQPFCCTWLWFAALLKSVCLLKSCKWNAQRGHSLSTHLLVSGLSRPQEHFSLIKTEARQCDGCMGSFDDSQQVPPPAPKTLWACNKYPPPHVSEPLVKTVEKRIEHFSKCLEVSVKQPPCLHGSKALHKAKCYIYSQGYLRNQRTWPPQTQPIS